MHRNATSRLVRNLVALAPVVSSPHSSISVHGSSAEQLRTERRGALVLRTDDSRHSQESQLDRSEQLSLERPGVKTVGRDLAL